MTDPSTGLVTAATRLRLSPSVTYRMLGKEGVEVTARGRTLTLAPGLFRVLLAFLTPTDAASVIAQLGPDAKLDELVTFCQRLAERGIVEAVDAPSARGLRELLRADLWSDPQLESALAAQLTAGRAVVIRDAFEPDFAERVHRDLDTATAWRPYEHTDDHFHYHHHNLFPDAELPAAVAECKRALSSAATVELMGRISGKDCSGPIQFGASLYLPGDHSQPHRDLSPVRAVAFVWHLTKAWEPRWGGAFYWCPTGTSVAPLFNCLTLFNVAPSSLHLVSAVSPYARGKRLAVSGWWNAAQPQPLPPSPPSPTGISEPRYGAAHTPLSADGRVLAI